MTLDRDLQLRVLRAMRDQYPGTVTIEGLADAQDPGLQGSLFYLAEHGLIKPIALRPHDSMGAPKQIFTAEISAAGLDFLEDDGGLSAILGTVRVRLDAQTLQALLDRKIAESSLPPTEKSALREKLKAFGGRILEQVVWKVIEKGLENPEALRSLFQLLAAGSGGHLPPSTLT